MIRVYTDGSILTNPGGPGGWAFVIPGMGGEDDIIRADKDIDTTNNRMEITAVLEALKFIREIHGEIDICVVSDSQYVVNTINDWIYKWVQIGFKKKKNADLWIQIYDIMRDCPVKAEWVRGHIGDKYNEMCDTLAREIYR